MLVVVTIVEVDVVVEGASECQGHPVRAGTSRPGAVLT